jgi:hypothetical protein
VRQAADVQATNTSPPRKSAPAPQEPRVAQPILQHLRAAAPSAHSAISQPVDRRSSSSAVIRHPAHRLGQSIPGYVEVLAVMRPTSSWRSANSVSPPPPFPDCSASRFGNLLPAAELLPSPAPAPSSPQSSGLRKRQDRPAPRCRLTHQKSYVCFQWAPGRGARRCPWQPAGVRRGIGRL